MKKGLIAGGIAAAVLVLGSVVPGLFIDQRHVSVRTASYPVPQAEVWEAITDWGSTPIWRNDVDGIEIIHQSGTTVFIETRPDGPMRYRVETLEAPERVATKIDDESLPFGGTWTFDLAPTRDGGTEVILTERGEIYSAPMRTFAALFMDFSESQDQYLRDLGVYLDAPVEPGPG